MQRIAHYALGRIESLSVLLLLPSLLFLAAVLFKHGLGMGMIFDALESAYTTPGVSSLSHVVAPLLLLGGSFLAFIFNVVEVIHVTRARTPNGIRLSMEFTFDWRHLLLVAASGFVLAVFLTYAFLENVRVSLY